jgi:hypothetical protein
MVVEPSVVYENRMVDPVRRHAFRQLGPICIEGPVRALSAGEQT